MSRHLRLLTLVAVASTRISFAADTNACKRLFTWLLPKNAQFKNAVFEVTETIANMVQSRKRFEGRETILGSPGERITLRLTKKLGAGFFGVVYAVEITSFDAGAQHAFPSLFSDGSARNDLVVKLPRMIDLPILSVANSVTRKSLREEQIDTARISAAIRELGLSPIPGSEILAFSDRAKELFDLPFLVKPRLSGCCSVTELSSIKKQMRLTEIQREKLRPIFETAKALYDKKNICLDLKPHNLRWNDEKQLWEMYEVTNIGLAADSFVREGFDSYVKLVEAAMNWK